MSDQGVILIAEDREDDLVLMRKGLAKTAFSSPILSVRDGEEAIAYLKGEGPYAQRDKFPLPDLLLLDLKMPRKDGFEVLRWVRKESSIPALRIVVLTSSHAPSDIDLAYRLGANAYLVKPLDLHGFSQICELIKGFWLHFNRNPELASARVQR